MSTCLIGGVKERPIAYKLGLGFCDHNHERKEALAGFQGMVNFAREVHRTLMSPVWRLTPRKATRSCREQVTVIRHRDRWRQHGEQKGASDER